MVNVIYSVLFASRKVSFLVLISSIAVHGYYYFSVSRFAEGLFQETAKSTFVDGSLTLVIIYVIGVAAERFLTQAIERAEKGADDNKKHESRFGWLVLAGFQRGFQECVN